MWSSPRGLRRAGKLDGTLIAGRARAPRPTSSARPATPHRHDALRAAGALILVGERLADVARRADARPPRSPTRTGARLAWIPRRAGERGAIDAGALPTLLPGGRPVTDDAARVEVERVWDAPVPRAPGRDLAAILAAAATATLGALLVGGVDPATCPTRAAAEAALAAPASSSASRCARAR